MATALTSFHRYLHIVLFKTYANLKAETDKTYIGCLWWVAEPLLNTALFYVVFTHIVGIRTPNFTVFLYIGMAIYGYFSNALLSGATAIVTNSNLMQQVNLPKPLFVFISISNLTWKFLFSLAVLFLLVWANGAPISWPYLSLPFLFLFQVWAAIGLAMPLAALIPYFQDGKTVLGTFLSVGMWFSGTFYEIDRVPASLRGLFYCNPIAATIDAMRGVLLHAAWPNPLHLAPAFAVCLLSWAIGLAMMRRIEGRVTKLAL